MDYRARFYDSLLGRFVQPDSLVPGAANPQMLNRYAYVKNNPINFSDPTGHKECNEYDENGNCKKEPKLVSDDSRTNQGSSTNTNTPPIVIPIPTPLSVPQPTPPINPESTPMPYTLTPQNKSAPTPDLTPYPPIDEAEQMADFAQSISVGMQAGDDVMNLYHLPSPVWFTVDFGLQLIRDSNKHLPALQYPARALAVATEGIAISSLSTSFSMGVTSFTAETGVGPVFGLTAYLTSSAAGSKAFDTLNKKYVFPKIDEWFK